MFFAALRLLVLMISSLFGSVMLIAEEVDFNKQIRSILSNKCFACHGPDEGKLQAGLRLDNPSTAIKPLESGVTAIVPGKPDESELIARITSTDPDVRMPPAEFGKPVTEAEIATIRHWIEQGAPYAMHWSYVKPTRPAVPAVPEPFRDWPRNSIDDFALSKMLVHGLKPSPEADCTALARRLFLDLTGLPPTVAEVDAFVNSTDPEAYEKLVDDLLQRPAYGEHWARQWLDLARYADSAGYADDPERTIWAYRDWVIRAFEKNMPFDQFTREQLAGDLIANPSEDQLIATAFHRNTMTNSEGGTNDEEFRNVAIVDRVNTTLAVWMGTTMACAQCHTHKYDPITQAEYFRVFAVFNNTEDADRRDESPLVELYTSEQIDLKQSLTEQIAALKKVIDNPTEAIVASQAAWEAKLNASSDWTPLKPSTVTRANGSDAVVADDVVQIPTAADKDTYTISIPVGHADDGRGNVKLPNQSIDAIRLETLPDESLPGKGSGHAGGNFVITQVKAQWVPDDRLELLMKARYVRIEIPGKQKILSLAETQVFSEGNNIATSGKATQSSTAYAGPPEYAIDGNTDGEFSNKSVTHTEISDDPWWELDLGSLRPIEKLMLWNRSGESYSRLNDFSVKLLDEERHVVHEQTVKEAPNPSFEFAPTGVRDLTFQAALADYQQVGFPSDSVLNGKPNADTGWAIGGATAETHGLVLVLTEPFSSPKPGTIRFVIEQNSNHKQHLLGKFRLQATDDDALVKRARLPKAILATLNQPSQSREANTAAEFARYYREQEAPELAPQRAELATATKQLANLKPATSVPVFRELVNNRRATHLQYRGNYLDQGPEVTPGVPAAFNPVPNGNEVNRMVLADWLMDENNPLTARVLANRYWETLFGRGIVVTSEEFGSQGETPTHPELLDWLATEIIANDWDLHKLLKLLVTSATYRQSSKVSAEQVLADRDNRWLGRGPRVRLSAEMVRDQALALSGLLSAKRFGPPVKPVQPNLGLSAAFGSSTDWKTSDGEDRRRRALYTTWRRSNPYPSMATFDAPNREVCTIRRNQTNTPLQSLVTLNDPAFVEAAQGLARSTLQNEGSDTVKIAGAFRKCLLREPTDIELKSLLALFVDSQTQLTAQPEEAKRLATDPLGPLPDGLSSIDAAAMTVVCNVLLNLDEMFLKR